MTDSMLSHDHAEVDLLLDDALAKLAFGDPVEAFGAIDLFWARLAMHIRAEHLHFFPAAVEIASREAISDIFETLERLRGDHDFFMHQLAELIKKIRTLKVENRGEAERVLGAIRERLIEHNAIEEARVYPLQRFLSEVEKEHLAASVTKELNKLPPRFGR